MISSQTSVFLLTDYGDVDEFAGVLRSVVARLAPASRIVDLTHRIEPFDVRAGALALDRCITHLGPGVVLAIVDPGVGTDRRCVAVEIAGDGPRFMVGPDNGLLIWAARTAGGILRAVQLAGQQPLGASGVTFAGRDVLAPAASRLLSGEEIGSLGADVDPAGLVRLPDLYKEVRKGLIVAEVTWIDSFGNVQTAASGYDARAAGMDVGSIWSLSVARGEPGSVISALKRPCVAVSTFGDLAQGAASLGVLSDANGHLALVMRESPAVAELQVVAGDFVCLEAAGQ